MFDAVIAGAGPAGGQCARELASCGRKVLLIEKAASFLENNFSSGAAPLEVMQDFALPTSIVGSYWNQFAISSSNEMTSWRAASPLGVVLEFEKLRAFLAEEAVGKGAEFRLGCSYLSHVVVGPRHVKVLLKDRATGEEFTIETQVLVDATGSERRLFGLPESQLVVGATGIEFHLQVDPKIYDSFANRLHFFLGHKWMPQGYGWIFPKAPGELKVGIVRYFQDQNIVPHEPSYRYYLDRLIKRCGPPDAFKLLDRHGKTVHYTYGQKDCRSQGPLVALGDAISTLNPLGCEGIRHALVSGRVAAIEVDRFLKGEVSSFKGYDRQMKSYFGYKWLGSEVMMHSLYKQTQDRALDHLVRNFKLMDTNTLMDVVFRYRFHRALPSYFFTYLARLQDYVGSVIGR